MSQAALADKIGVEQKAVSLWETGVTSPRADKLPQLANVLGCEINDLFKPITDIETYPLMLFDK